MGPTKRKSSGGGDGKAKKATPAKSSLSESTACENFPHYAVQFFEKWLWPGSPLSARPAEEPPLGDAQVHQYVFPALLSEAVL